MARKRKPCPFCECDEIYNEEGSNGFQACVEVYPDSNIIAFTAFAPDENGEQQEKNFQIQMNFCPECGRNLQW